MGTVSSVPSHSPLGCLLENLKSLHLTPELKGSKLIRFCNKIWPKYHLDNQSKWPRNGTLDPNIIRDLYNYCERLEKWKEIFYVQAFSLLRSKPSLCASCSPTQLLLARKSEQDDPSTTFDPANEPSPRRTKPSAPPLVLAPPISLPPSSVTSHPSQHSLAPSFSSPPTVPSPPTTRSRSTKGPPPLPPQPKPAPVLPLREVAGVDGLVKVHVPFSLTELSQIDKRLGSYSANPSTFIKEFQYITQSYNLTFHDVYMILTNNLLPEERRRVWEQARIYADDIHQTDDTYPVGSMAVPDQEPDWDYNTPGGILARKRFLTCLLAGLRKAALKAVNYERIQRVIQDKDENPSQFLDRLTKALLQYTNVDPETQDGNQLLMTYFFSQSYPDIRAKLRRLEKGPLTPQSEALNVAFKVYHGRDEKAQKQKYLMMAKTSWPAKTKAQAPKGQRLLRPCFKCGQEGHWARACPNPRKPPGPCPRCDQEGHWSIDCPHVPDSMGTSIPDRPSTDLLGLAIDD